MTSIDTEHNDPCLGQLADTAANAIRLLNHRTRPSVSDLTGPAEAAQVIGALASAAGMLPQLLSQLARWLEHEQQHQRLRVDTLAPLPNPRQTVDTLTRDLNDAIQSARHTATHLDTAHQHAAHLAAAEPTITNQNTTTSGA